MRHFVALAALCGFVAYAWLFARPSADPPIRSDGYNYYLYAASWVVYHDVTLEKLATDWNGGAYPAFAGMVRWPGTDHWMNRHPIGVSLLMLPFVVAADLLTRWSNLPRDGFSFYYQHAAALAGLAYFLAGLAILRRTLSRHFTPSVTLWTLVAITFGTNLFHYAVYDGTFSHVFSFALVCALVEILDLWSIRRERWHAPVLGIVSGLIVLVRHTNVLFLLLVPLWPEKDRQWRKDLAVAAAVAAVCLLPQLALYRWSSGRWLVNAYAPHGGGFTFLSPHLFGALFSTQRGLFFWSPVLLFSIAGLFVARGWAREGMAAWVVVLALDAWLIASWTEWQYGASFGHRAFIDGLALFALPLASFFTWVSGRPRLTPVIAATATLAVALSCAQMIQYWLRIWPVRDITWSQYRALFLEFR